MLGAHLACPSELAWHLTQHNGQGLDHSIVHKELVDCGYNHGKDIVFRFIIEYSSLMDFDP